MSVLTVGKMYKTIDFQLAMQGFEDRLSQIKKKLRAYMFLICKIKKKENTETL